MPAVPLSQAMTTRDSIANMWASAQSNGEQGLTILLPSRHACYATRNQLYKHRSRLRKAARAHTGFDASAYDHLKIFFKEEIAIDCRPTGKWLFHIGPNDFAQFELFPTRSGRVAISSNDLPEEEPNHGQEGQGQVPQISIVDEENFILSEEDF